MKKIGVLALGLILVFGMAGTAFAASIFADVPRGDWTYASLAILQKAGIIEGYADDAFKGDKVLSRYELAIVVGRAVENSEKANAEQKQLIAKLKVEFSNELAKLDTPITTEKDKADNVKLSGYFSARYQQTGANNPGEDWQRLYTWLQADIKLSDKWSGHFGSEAYSFMGKDTRNLGQDQLITFGKSAYLNGKMGEVDVTLGKTWKGFGNNEGIGYFQTGLWLDFGNKVKTTLFVAQIDGTGSFLNGNDPGKTSANGYGVNFNSNISKNTNINLLLAGNDVTAEGQSKDAAFAVNTQLSNDWTFNGAYSKTNADKYNSNYRYGFQYKKMDSNIAGSYDIFVNYAKYQRNGSMNGSAADDDWDHFYVPKGATVDSANYTYIQGYTIGFDYALGKNVDLQTMFYSQKLGKLSTATNPGEVHRNVFRTFVNYHF